LLPIFVKNDEKSPEDFLGENTFFEKQALYSFE